MRPDSSLLEQLCEDLGLMFQMHFQFQSNQQDVFSSTRTLLLFDVGQLVSHPQGEDGWREG